MNKDLVAGLNYILGSRNYNQNSQHATVIFDYIMNAPEAERINLFEHVIKNFKSGNIEPTNQYTEIPPLDNESYGKIVQDTKITELLSDIFEKREEFPSAKNAAQKIFSFIESLKTEKEKTVAISVVMFSGFCPYPVCGISDITDEEWRAIVNKNQDKIDKIIKTAEDIVAEKLRFNRRSDHGQFIIDLIEKNSDDHKTKVVLTFIFTDALMNAAKHNPCGCISAKSALSAILGMGRRMPEMPEMSDVIEINRDDFGENKGPSGHC